MLEEFVGSPYKVGGLQEAVLGGSLHVVQVGSGESIDRDSRRRLTATLPREEWRECKAELEIEKSERFREEWGMLVSGMVVVSIEVTL